VSRFGAHRSRGVRRHPCRESGSPVTGREPALTIPPCPSTPRRPRPYRPPRSTTLAPQQAVRPVQSGNRRVRLQVQRRLEQAAIYSPPCSGGGPHNRHWQTLESPPSQRRRERRKQRWSSSTPSFLIAATRGRNCRRKRPSPLPWSHRPHLAWSFY